MFAGAGAKVLVADVDHPAAQAVAAVSHAVSGWGSLDYAVNNAASAPDEHEIADLDLAEFDRVIAVNLRAVAICLSYEMRQMRGQNSPSAIVNISSIRGHRGVVSSAAYAAAKHGVIGLTRTAAAEGADCSIRVNPVGPGATDTPVLRQAPQRGGVATADRPKHNLMGRDGAPNEIAEASLWLCSRRASFVTGTDITVDGGYLAMP
jgi:glucose 1-dehydrogenase